MLLCADRLCVAYGRIEAVREVSLDVPPGSIVAVIGANGAGKTTLLNALMGLIPARGELRYAGARVDFALPEERVARGLVLVPERRELFGAMSVEDNLRLGAYHRRRSVDLPGELRAVYARFPRLEERRRQLAATLSGGERQMLALGRALMAKPRLLMLDEPSLGLAPLLVQETFRIVGDLRAAGVSILLIEQNARAALRIADHAYVMETGSVVLAGPAHTVAEDPRVSATYLGSGGAPAA